MPRSNRGPRFNADDPSSIAADPVVDRGPVDQDLPLGRPRMDLRVRAGLCTQRGPSRVEPPGPVDVLVLAPLGLVLARVPVLAPLGLVPVVQLG